ncbi:hypothetical protein [Methanobrevibacter sp.]|uniref:hypothetical protein n=1 Tax=Methanobrevibacter sp. TaxID=66852 RepID=UPI00386FC610
MKFKKSHILLISLISLFLLLGMSAVSAASDDASIAQPMEIDDVDAIDDMGNDDILSDDDGTEGGNNDPVDPGTGETTDPLPVSNTTITSENKTYTFGSNITFKVNVTDNQSAEITNIGPDNFKVFYQTNTTDYKEIDYNYSDSIIQLDFDTNKTLPVQNYTIKIVFVNSVIGGVNYTESETTIDLNITQTTTTITATNVSYEIADEIIIPVTMKVESGKTLNFNITNMKVYLVNVDGTYNELNYTKVNGNDIKLLNLTGLGENRILLNYTGNENCLPISCTVKVELNKTVTHIDANDVKIKKGEDVIIPFDVRMTSNNTIKVNQSNITVYLNGDEGNLINFTLVNDGIKLLNLTDEFGNYSVYIGYKGVDDFTYSSNKTVKVSILENNTINAKDTIYVYNNTKNVTIPINITNGNSIVALNKTNITLVLKYLDGETNVTEIVTDFDLTGENGNYVINFTTDHFNNSELTIIYSNGTLNETEKTVTLKWCIDVVINATSTSADFQQGEFNFTVYYISEAGEYVPLPNATISVNVEGASFYTINGYSIFIGPRDFTTDENGTIIIKNDKSFNLVGFSQSFLPAGNYNVTFDTKDHYVVSEKKEITVNKAQAKIIASPIVVEYESGKKLNYTFQVINSNTGEAIGSVRVQFRIYSPYIDTTINGTTNSTGHLTIHNMSLIGGVYNLTLKSIDGSLICSAVKQNITIKPRDVVISANNRTILYGSDVTVVATVKDKKTGNPVPNAYVLVKVYITSTKVSNFVARTDSKGVIRFSTGLSVGKHKVIISMYDTSYKSGSLTRYVTVKKATGQFSAPSVSTYYKSGRYYKVKLTNTKNKALMYGATVNIKVYVSKYRYYNLTGVTGANGLVQFKITFKPGTYKVVVSSADKGYSAKAVTSQIKVSKSPIKIAPTSLKVKRYSYFKVKVTSTKSKKVLSGVKVKVRVYTGRKYKTYTIKTNKKGIASLKISQKRGKHKVVLSPGSPTYYYAKAITRTLTVTR